jgi:HPt (histidine-containing phosphotransfer) domain-containing protein
MDIQMPVLDGVDATREIRKDARFRDLPVVAMTANAMQGDRDRCLAAGMDDYLAKPYSMQALQQTLGRWLGPEGDRANTDADPASVAASTLAIPVEARGASLNLQFLDQLRELDPAGGMGLARNILQVYLESSGKLVSQAESAIAASDAEALRIAAHTLKSSSANVGAEKVSALFKQLEALGRESKLEQAGLVFDQARHEYNLAINEIRALLTEAA